MDEEETDDKGGFRRSDAESAAGCGREKVYVLDLICDDLTLLKELERSCFSCFL